MIKFNTEKRYHFTESSYLELVYCYLVAGLEDWYADYFCETALIDHFYQIQEDYANHEGVVGEAAKLSFEQIQDLQERLKGLGKEGLYSARSDFLSAINCFRAM